MKLVSRLLSLLVLPVAFVILMGSACDGGTNAPPIAWARGAFQPMAENTKSYALPAGVSEDSLFGYEDDTDSLGSDTPLYLVVSNSNSTDTKVTFPAGLLFNPVNTADFEYMMLVKEFSFTAKGGGTTIALVPSYGCNSDSLDAPAVDAFYSIGDKEWDKETQELFNLIAGKTIQGDSAKELVQDALDEITGPDFPDGLTEATRTLLKALP
jgi:hypothetical protein